MIKIIFIMLTYNRLDLTKKSLESLLKNKYPFHLVIHDNGSTEEGMIEYLKEMKIKDERIVDLTFSRENLGLSKPTNAFWEKYYRKYPYLGKIDNDTVVPEDGVERLVDVLDHCPHVGICHGYHGKEKDDAFGVLTEIDGRLFAKARWGGGCFYAMRSSIVNKYGFISTKYGLKGGWTRYQIRVRKRGYKIVYPFPLVRVNHLG